MNCTSHMKRNLLIPALLALLLFPSCGTRHERPEAKVQKDTVYPLGFCTDSFSLRSGELKKGQLFTTLMSELGMDPAASHRLASSLSDSIFNVRTMRPGDPWEAYYDSCGTDGGQRLRYLVYSRNKVEQTVFSCSDSLCAWLYRKPLEHSRKYSDITISSSLWNDMNAAGASPLLIIKLSDIYAWTVDFFSLQKNDRFRVIYSEETCDGELIDIDSIYFARFDRGDKALPAIMLNNHDGGNIYWNEKGESLRKAFLKAPLQFSRISSGFSYNRKHPVHGVVRPHTGIDYAAPTGTPVVSIGDGTVISKGWSGGGGNTVKIRHNSVYTSAYLHLSKYGNIKVGDRVSQGQVIGYVGMTGTATGPHLDFRIWKNGTPINPLTMEAPPSEPISPDRMPVLDSVYRALNSEMDSLGRLASIVPAAGAQ